MTIEETPTAFLNGRDVTLMVALEEAAKLLKASRQPLFAGLGTDIEGARVAIGLTQAMRGIYDHALFGDVFNTLAIVQSDGFMHTTPGEVRQRADTVLLIGPQILQAWPELMQSLALNQLPKLALNPMPRTIIWLGANGNTLSPDLPWPPDLPCENIALSQGSMLVSLSVLRALVAGRPVLGDQKPLVWLAKTLKQAKIGAVIYAQAGLSPLETEMLSGLVRDLNRTTRFSSLPLAPAANAQGVMLASGWMTGFAPRTSFASGLPIYDPIMFDTDRLLASGEVDLTLWIDAFGQLSPPKFQGNTIAFTAPSARFLKAPDVHFYVSAPGIGHSGVLWSAEIAGLQAFSATAPSHLPNVATLLRALAEKADRQGGLPC